MTKAVETEHPELDAHLHRWKQVDDVVESRVKGCTTEYLPKPNAQLEQDRPDVKTFTHHGQYNASAYATACHRHTQAVLLNNTRYSQYVNRALFMNFTKRTLAGMIGGVFRKDAKVEIPTGLNYLIDDVDGSGMSVDQQVKSTLDQVLRKGRRGLLVDMPQTEGVLSKADIDSGRKVPRIKPYDAQHIVNWKSQIADGVEVLSLIVLVESYDTAEDEFSHKCEPQYRVLRLEPEGYAQEVYRNGELVERSEPRANGSRIKRIPFYFVGADENDSSIDAAPLFDLSEINLAHYRNSADNEESSFICGQPTLVIAPSELMGNPEAWQQANPNGVSLGSRSGINVGAGGSAQLLQAAENNLAKQNMRDKEEQALAMGAELITPSSQETAEAARIKRGADTSVLSSVAQNVSRAYTKALMMCGEFLGISGNVSYELNDDFFLSGMTAQDRSQWVMEINAGLLPKASMYSAYRKAGLVDADATDEDIAGQLELEGGSNEGLI